MTGQEVANGQHVSASQAAWNAQLSEGRRMLAIEIAAFVGKMEFLGFPEQEELEVVRGHKTGWRYWLKSQRQREIRTKELGWVLYFGNHPEFNSQRDEELASYALLAVSATGELLQERLWYDYAPLVVDELTGEQLANSRYYLHILDSLHAGDMR
ncbi:MAG: hypothetical protein ACM3KF_04115 [Acidobacteriota bacterium]